VSLTAFSDGARARVASELSRSGLPSPWSRRDLAAPTVSAVLLLATGLAVSQLAAWTRRLKVIALTDEGYLATMHGTAAKALASRSQRRWPSMWARCSTICWSCRSGGSSAARCEVIRRG
jgi:hypothetical protein